MAVPPRVKVFFDGGCRPGPNGMESAVVARGQCYLQHYPGPGSSMDAEWLALLHAVEVAGTLGLANPVFLGDALAVVLQANGVVKCQGSSVGHLQALRAMAASGPSFHIRHLKRTQNLAGIALARLHAR